LRLPRLLIPGCALLAFAAAPAAALASGGGGLVGTPTAAPAAAPPAPATSTGAPVTQGGGSGLTGPPVGSTLNDPTVPGTRAKVIHGVAYAPAFAPAAVQRAIWAGDAIDTKPYILGGGHGRWRSAGYDCSGAVSYVLHAAGMLKTSEDSGQLERWGARGLGQWITVYTNQGHAFIEIAGVRFDTSAEDDPDPPPGTGPRWRPFMHGAPGFVARHPADY
jgi:cell wall-associated NlpC family hydrolase